MRHASEEPRGHPAYTSTPRSSTRLQAPLQLGDFGGHLGGGLAGEGPKVVGGPNLLLVHHVIIHQRLQGAGRRRRARRLPGAHPAAGSSRRGAHPLRAQAPIPGGTQQNAAPACSTSLMLCCTTPRLDPSFSMSCGGRAGGGGGMGSRSVALRRGRAGLRRRLRPPGCAASAAAPLSRARTLSVNTSLVSWKMPSSVCRFSSADMPLRLALQAEAEAFERRGCRRLLAGCALVGGAAWRASTLPAVGEGSLCRARALEHPARSPRLPHGRLAPQASGAYMAAQCAAGSGRREGECGRGRAGLVAAEVCVSCLWRV